MNNKGFISISVVYSFFIVFLMLLLFIVDVYVNNRYLIKKISAKVTEEAMNVSYCEANIYNKVCNFYKDYNPRIQKNITLTNDEDDTYYIYYHDEDLVNGAGDNSYRFAGANPNNYVCFGSNAITCPADNIYRLIGIIPVEVVTDSTTTPLTTEVQKLYKLIKNDYINIGAASTGPSVYDGGTVNPFNGPSGNQYTATPKGYYWSGSSSNGDSVWSTSLLNTEVLNQNFYNTFSNVFKSYIADVYWKVGGNAYNNVSTASPMNVIYTNEISNSGIMPENYIGSWTDPSDNNKELVNKIGLLYISDYGYTALQSSWTYPLYNTSGNDYRLVIENNWLYRGITDWTITRDSSVDTYVFNVTNEGWLSRTKVNTRGFGVRPVFYLNDNVKIITNGHSGSITDPFRVV